MTAIMALELATLPMKCEAYITPPAFGDFPAFIANYVV
jgi:hypothetical protein